MREQSHRNRNLQLLSLRCRLKPSRRGGHDLNCLAPDNFPTNCDCLPDDGGSYSTEPTLKLTIEIEFALESDNFILMM